MLYGAPHRYWEDTWEPTRQKRLEIKDRIQGIGFVGRIAVKSREG